MRVDRRLECLRGLEDRPEELVVEEAVERAAVDERSLEAELPDGPGQLVGRRVRVGGRQRREGGEAVRMGRDGLGHPVVERLRHGNGSLGAAVLQAGLHRGQDLHVDPLCVHLGDPALAQVEQPRLERRRPAVDRVVRMDLRA